MRVLIAPDSFKGSLTADAAAEAMAAGLHDACPTAQADVCPIADGGEGTLDAVLRAAGDNARMMSRRVTGPLGETVYARWGLIDDGATAVIEMAQAAGLMLLPDDRRDPTRTTTFGVGELISAALDAGVRRIVIGIGGSATCDGGAGMAQALGVRFACDNRVVNEPMCGATLTRLTAIDRGSIDPRLAVVHVDAACDVNNPLCGPEGTAAVYGPQKGATPAQVALLDAGLRRLASLLPHVDAAAPGAGAAGGLGFGLVAFCGARRVRGVTLVLDAVGFERRVAAANLVLTGEGRLDGQSASGKACAGMAEVARRHGVAAIAIVGATAAGYEVTMQSGLAAVYAICDGRIDRADSMAHAAEHLRRRTAEATAEWIERRGEQDGGGRLGGSAR